MSTTGSVPYTTAAAKARARSPAKSRRPRPYTSSTWASTASRRTAAARGPLFSRP